MVKREAEFDPVKVRDISVAVYSERLGPGGAERMLAKDADGGALLRDRAKAYDSLTRSYLRAMEAVSGCVGLMICVAIVAFGLF